MYSVVLMMALTSGTETPSFGGRRGCAGCQGYYGCSACHGCQGGRRDRGRRGCRGCRGCQVVYVACHGGCHGGYHGCAGGGMPPPPPPGPPRKPEPIKKPSEQKESSSPAPARLLVSLPAEAILFIDGTSTTATSTQRAFITPEIDRDRDYFYTLRAEWLRDGQKLTLTKRVPLRAGNETHVTLDFSEALTSN